MKIQYNISNLKAEGVELPIFRKIEGVHVQENVDAEYNTLVIDVICQIKCYTDSERTNLYKALPGQKVILRVDNTTTVDKTTGNYADETTLEENKIGELDFFLKVNFNSSIENFLLFALQRADSQNRFDN